MGACSAADGGAASPGPGRAGFLKIFQILFLIRFQILGRARRGGSGGRAKREGAKNLDVMGFEPMTSGLEPAPLPTRQLGPCLKMVAVRRFWRSEQNVFGGRSDQKLQFSKRKSGFAMEQKFLGGDPTKNCNFQGGKVGLLWSKNFQIFNFKTPFFSFS